MSTVSRYFSVKVLHNILLDPGVSEDLQLSMLISSCITNLLGNVSRIPWNRFWSFASACSQIVFPLLKPFTLMWQFAPRVFSISAEAKLSFGLGLRVGYCRDWAARDTPIRFLVCAFNGLIFAVAMVIDGLSVGGDSCVERSVSFFHWHIVEQSASEFIETRFALLGDVFNRVPPFIVRGVNRATRVGVSEVGSAG